ncbi:formyltransferase family protein [Campylobacter mucosalis]|uniref:formyltransferase family protein n=1 Tax=Campylobacter mucosalis TaxID=202 RepID=UPI001470133C|nr:formyltransferase family protein [Campylobacter mucosalis]
MKIAVLTSPNQWFVPYAKNLSSKLNAQLFYDHTEIFGFDIVFVLSYHRIIADEFLCKNKHNIVIHESDLPQGKGWAPLFHQVLEGKNEIIFTLFEADTGTDSGLIYAKKTLCLTGNELYDELRKKQALMSEEMCFEFIKNYDNLKPQAQSGDESFYPKRTPKDSQLDTSKSLDELFNQLRVVSNDDFPAFFYKNGQKFILKIYSEGGGKRASLNSFCFAFSQSWADAC